jgi:DNA mismatch endonuclease (patch repair protein)
MRRQRQKDTACELAVRRLLHGWGMRYRVDCRPEPDVARRADIVFRSAKMAVFVDGCFWHGCPVHWKAPKRNATWWIGKITANVERDARTNQLLERRGWLVIRAWEHESPRAIATRVASSLKHRRES